MHLCHEETPFYSDIGPNMVPCLLDNLFNSEAATLLVETPAVFSFHINQQSTIHTICHNFGGISHSSGKATANITWQGSRATKVFGGATLIS